MVENDLDSKLLLTLKEASQYSGIGLNTLRDITNAKDCDFVLFIGNKRMIKRKKFEDFIDRATYI